jgi:hypothetical protein
MKDATGDAKMRRPVRWRKNSIHLREESTPDIYLHSTLAINTPFQEHEPSMQSNYKSINHLGHVHVGFSIETRLIELDVIDAALQRNHDMRRLSRSWRIFAAQIADACGRLRVSPAIFFYRSTCACLWARREHLGRPLLHHPRIPPVRD